MFLWSFYLNNGANLAYFRLFGNNLFFKMWETCFLMAHEVRQKKMLHYTKIYAFFMFIWSQWSAGIILFTLFIKVSKGSEGLEILFPSSEPLVIENLLNLFAIPICVWKMYFQFSFNFLPKYSLSIFHIFLYIFYIQRLYESCNSFWVNVQLI